LVFWIAHGVHLAIIVGGAIGVLALLGPEAERRLRVRRLRTAVRTGRLVEWAARRAWIDQAAGRTIALRTQLLLGFFFAAGCIVLAVVGNRLAGAARPTGWSLAGSLGVAFVIGVLLYRKRRNVRTILLVAVPVQLLLHAGLILLPELSALRRSASLTQSFANAFFCHTAGAGPSSATVRAAAARIGVKLPPPGSASGFLSPASTALAVGLLIATGVLALYLRSLALPTRPAATRQYAGKPSLEYELAR
jgi:hypothetical protein